MSGTARSRRKRAKRVSSVLSQDVEFYYQPYNPGLELPREANKEAATAQGGHDYGCTQRAMICTATLVSDHPKDTGRNRLRGQLSTAFNPLQLGKATHGLRWEECPSLLQTRSSRPKLGIDRTLAPCVQTCGAFRY